MEKKEIFSLELNEEGIHWIRRYQSVAMFVFLATVFFNGMNLYNTLPYILEANKDISLPSKFRLNNSIFVVQFIVQGMLQVIHAFFYYQFSVFSHRALNDENSIELNQSFRWLYWQAVTLLAQVCLSLAYFLFSSIIKNLN